jgi:hypothetical protein
MKAKKPMEEFMKIKKIQNNYMRHVRRAALVAVMLTAALPPAWARGHKPAAQAVQVVSKLPFQGKTSADMVLHEVDGKSYLYVRFGGDAGIMVVDVTHPDKPKTVSSLQSSSASSARGLAIEKDIALVTGGAFDAGPATSVNDHLTVWDISDAGAPRIVQEFAGVKRVIEDARGYIYILDGEALWVVADKPDEPAGQDDMLAGTLG